MTKDINFELICKLNAYILDFLKSNSSPKLLKLDIQNKDKYLIALDSILLDANCIIDADFILPNGKLKKLQFDLTNFKIPELYYVKFGMTNENIYSRMHFDHKLIKYKGFDLEDVLLVGCFKVGYDLNKKEFGFWYNSGLYKPTQNIIDCLCNLNIQMNKIYYRDCKNKKKIYIDINDYINTIKNL